MVEDEEGFRNAVEVLLLCQRTEPRMSGYQKQLKQSHAARTDDDAHHDPQQVRERERERGGGKEKRSFQSILSIFS